MTDRDDTGLPRWLIWAILAVALLLVVTAAAWLLMGGANKVLGWLPDGVVKVLGERPGEGKRVEQKLSDYPGERAATADDEGVVDPEELQRLLGPLQTQAQAADEAIAALRSHKRGDQGAILAAETAVEELRSFRLVDLPKAYRRAAEDKRRTLTDERVLALQSAKKLAKATHIVVGTAGTALLELRKAADARAESVTGLEDGTLVQVHLDTGKGWSRLDVLSGAAAGKGGYLQNGALKRLPATQPTDEP